MSSPTRGSWPSRILAGALAVLLTGAVVGLSQVPYEATSGEGARIRLSWRFRAAVEECRELSEEELAELPAHMRRSTVCERTVPPHHLRVEVDGRALLDETIRAAGAQADHPLYVFREVPVEPGRHDVRVRFERLDGEADAAEPLVLETTLDLEPREVGLITYDPGAGLLRRVESAGSGG